MKTALVTGASGFIGSHLVAHLIRQGVTVTGLVRESSDVSMSKNLDVQWIHGDITDRESIDQAMAGRSFDAVFHLAGLTKSLQRKSLFEVNEQGSRNVAAACASCTSPPTLIILSSLAASGPTRGNAGRRETDQPAPVSDYGKSKLAGELAACEFADSVPISIVRPPIVLGEGDRDGLTMYQSIQSFRLHLVPGFFDNQYSVIHADDLTQAVWLVARQGDRVISNAKSDAGEGVSDAGKGVYFAAADETLTYADLGREIAKALDRPAFMVRFPGPIVWAVAGVSDWISRFTQKPSLLNLDKAREATAGSWICDDAKIRDGLNFQPAKSFSDRLCDTVNWYSDQGWLNH